MPITGTAFYVGRITYTAPPDADTKHLQLRQCPPPDYSSDDETIVATNLPDAPRVFDTKAGHVGQGDSSLFTVYVVNEDDREKGSNVVDIAWPTT